MADEFFYLATRPGACFARYFEGKSGRAGPVLILPPFGWEELSAHKALELWAARLSNEGHPVLTIDLPGEGDSGELAPGADRFAAWQLASLDAAAWLRSRSSDGPLTVVGLRLGGLLAHHVAAANQAEQVVLWATPGSGRRALRELKAFSALEAGQIVESGGPEAPPLPDGSLAPGGFLIEGRTSRELERAELEALPARSGLRALLLGADGLPPDSGLVASFEDARAELSIGAGHGLGSMLTDPDQSEPPWSTFDEIQAWLEERPVEPPIPRPDTSPPVKTRSDNDLGLHRERPVTIPTKSGTLIGIASEPASVPRAPATAVFLNAGAIPRIGPHRLWVETARRWAGESGVPSLRVDLEGIGDSDGDGNALREVANFHDPSFADQVRLVLDKAESEGFVAPFLLVGLCSGSYWAFQTALLDPRVATALMINPRILHWDPEIDIRRDLRRTRLLGSSTTWRRLLRGEVSRERWAAVAKSLAAAPARRWRRGLHVLTGHQTTEQLIASSFDLLKSRGQNLFFVFCAGEPLREELEQTWFRSRASTWPDVTIKLVPGRDHTFRPPWMHAHLSEAMDEALRLHLDRQQRRAPATDPRALAAG
jgi:hypothetical protein